MNNITKQESEIRLSRATIHCFRRRGSRALAQHALENAEFAARYVTLSDDVTVDLKIINDQLEKLL